MFYSAFQVLSKVTRSTPSLALNTFAAEVQASAPTADIYSNAIRSKDQAAVQSSGAAPRQRNPKPSIRKPLSEASHAVEAADTGECALSTYSYAY